MAMKRFDHVISDEVIRDKMLKHSKTSGEVERNLIHVKVPNGQGDRGEGHDFYALHGSPVKGFAFRRRDKLHMYESDGTRWATYKLVNGRDPIKHEISKSTEDLTEMFAENMHNHDDIDVVNRVLGEVKERTSLFDHAVDPEDVIDEFDADFDLEDADTLPPGRYPDDSKINMLNKMVEFREQGFQPFKVLRPYDAEFEEVQDLISICKEYGCEFKIVGASNYFSGSEKYNEITFSIILARPEE